MMMIRNDFERLEESNVMLDTLKSWIVECS